MRVRALVEQEHALVLVAHIEPILGAQPPLAKRRVFVRIAAGLGEDLVPDRIPRLGRCAIQHRQIALAVNAARNIRACNIQDGRHHVRADIDHGFGDLRAEPGRIAHDQRDLHRGAIGCVFDPAIVAVLAQHVAVIAEE